MKTVVWDVSAVVLPVVCSVTASGDYRRPAATRSSASATTPGRNSRVPGDPGFSPPIGLRFPSKSYSASTPKRFVGTLRKCRASALGSRPHSQGSARCDPNKIGKFNKRRHYHVPEQSNPHRFPRQRCRSSHREDLSFTTFSLATKSSYKDKNSSQYISHTEWHRCVVFGRLSEFAKTLTKGAHVQVEGELRSREYTSKKTDTEQRIWEIRVGTILKLDRAEKSQPEEPVEDEDGE